MQRVILFDGVCHFCDTSVQFIIRRDPEGYFKFVALQSDVGSKLLQQHHITHEMDSFILIDHDRYYIKSSAALQVCRKLRGWYKCLYVLIIIPRPIRDFFYDLFAKRRYRWFGRKDSCTLPTAEQRERFLS